jgi:hypothetical protein
MVCPQTITDCKIQYFILLNYASGLVGRRRKRFARLRQILRQRMNRDWNIRQKMSRNMNIDRRCVQSCPVCDPLDTDKYTVDEITGLG